MRRTKEWWARLTPEERSELVYIERNASQASVGWDGYLPDDCGECNVCGSPTMGTTCMRCLDRWSELIDKANGKEGS